LAGFPLSSNYSDQLKNYSRHFRLKASTLSKDDAVFLSGSECGLGVIYRVHLPTRELAGFASIEALTSKSEGAVG
jgi:hypothetical protein